MLFIIDKGKQIYVVCNKGWLHYPYSLPFRTKVKDCLGMGTNWGLVNRSGRLGRACTTMTVGENFTKMLASKKYYNISIKNYTFIHTSYIFTIIGIQLFFRLMWPKKYTTIKT